RRASVADPGLADLHGPDPRGDRAGGQVTVADDLAMAVVIEAVLVVVDPLGHFGVDGLGQELLGSGPEDVGEDVGGTGQWHSTKFVGTVNHGGVLLGLVGPLVDSDTPRVRRLSSSRYPQHLIIPPRRAASRVRSAQPTYSGSTPTPLERPETMSRVGGRRPS